MKQSKSRLKLAILLLAFCQGSNSIAVPAVDTISKAYPDVPQAIALMVGTVPIMVAIPISLVSAVLYKVLGYKKTAILAVLLIGLGGLLPVFIPGFPIMLISRMIVGVGYGISCVLPQTLIGIFLAGDKSQKSYYGYAVAMLGAAGILFSQLGGILSDINIKWMWLLHAAFLLVLPVVSSGIREPEEKEMAVQTATETDEKSSTNIIHMIPPVFFWILVLHFITGITNMTWYANTSYLAAEIGIANVGAFAGTLLAGFNAGSFIGGMLVGRVARFTKHYTVVLGIVFCVIGCGITYMTDNRGLLVAAALIMGLCDSTVYSSCFTITGYLVPGKANGLAVGIINAVVQCGCFVGPYIPLTIIMTMMGTEAVIPQIGFVTALALINAIVYTITLRTKACKKLRMGYAGVETEA